MSDINATEATEATEAVQSDADKVETGTEVTGTTGADRAAYEALKAEYDAFKRQVAETTGRYAKRHDMCGVVDTALAELGLRRPILTNKVEVTLKLSYSAEVPAGRSAIGESDVWTMLHNVAYHLRHDDAQGTERNYAGVGLAIEAAEVTITDTSDTEAAHILPGGPVRRCTNCDRTMRDGACPRGCVEYAH